MAETAQDASAPLSRPDKMKDEDMDEGESGREGKRV
jgi:hypothetical protein